MRDVLTGVIGFLAISALVLHFENPFAERELVYVNLPDVFNQFTMKEELGAELDNILLARKGIVDSLKQDYNRVLTMNGGVGNQPSERLLQEIRFREARFEEENELAAKQYNEQIWKQLNTYMKEFGESSGYEIILGAQGDGGLIYAAGSRNITQELIDHVNKRYQGL